MGNDVAESYHKPFESDSSKIFSSQSRVMTWSSQSWVTKTVESLVSKLRSVSSQM